jgi:hypothetical protein
MTPPDNRFDQLFAQHRSASVPDLWPWQREVLAAYDPVDGDVAVELPTGTGKTLLGLLAGDDFRLQTGKPVAYLAGNKQLAQQVERQARDLRFSIVRFQGPKDSWAPRDVRAYSFGTAIGVMNYWNYFNANPGIEPAGLLILDDVHLLEQPLRDIFTVSIPRTDGLYQELLERIVARCPYYTLANDLLNDVEHLRPPEMLAFSDSADLAAEVRDLLDGRLLQGSEAWWAWQQIRHRLEACCWLVSRRAVTFTPYIPPSQTIRHFSQPDRRLYLSATIGSVDDLRRRLGTPPVTKLTASVQPRQGDRLVVIRDATDPLDATEHVDALYPFLKQRPKALWLCARRDTASALEVALTLAGLPGTVRILEGDNGADEPFATDAAGHLIAAGRYDGMDFPDDSCRVEVLPEVPVATSDLEEWASAFLRDAAFAEARFGQRVAQGLGRCNRSEYDRAVYFLTDPEFLTRFSERRTVDALPDDVRADIYSGLERSDRGFSAGLTDAERFLSGTSFPAPPPPARIPASAPSATAGDEVQGTLALWREDYGRAATLFDQVASHLADTREHRAFWLAMRALSLQLAGSYGDQAAEGQAVVALRAAATAGATSTFFTRLRLAESRRRGETIAVSTSSREDLFAIWDEAITRYGSAGPRFDRWANGLTEELQSNDHDAVARAIARVGNELLGLLAEAPKPTSGEHDAHWELLGPHRLVAFEVKMAPTAQRVINDDVEQAEGAVRALEAQRSRPVRGFLVAPWTTADQSALDRLDRVRLIRRDLLVEEILRWLTLLRDYRHGWSEDASVRGELRRAVEARVPEPDWLWQAHEGAEKWIERSHLTQAWPGPISAR